MKNFKGTPGPWVINDNGHYLEIGSTKNGDIAEVGPSQHWYDNGDRNGLVTTANALLIAASPSLLSALQRLVEVYDDPTGKQCTTTSKREALDKAREAINLALGE